MCSKPTLSTRPVTTGSHGDTAYMDTTSMNTPDSAQQSAASALATSGLKSRKVLLPVDERNSSRRAMQWYLDEIYQKNDYVILIHIFKTAILPLFSYGAVADEAWGIGQWQQQFGDAQERALDVVNIYKEVLESKQIPFRIITTPGSAGHVICTIANEHQVNLIVMGSRGVGMITRTVLGSVSDYVLHNANVPVTIVPPRE
ncbi:universal stress protein Slr1101-like [Corticium candelabrum]|uniref:universal stress protein Slr1101-like n=1 Tax=Corticium candelabrum TaxID=121492 RepID=UPI002E2687FA|nr:universal stress protein Slr1101-like [Corticium candelabrum]